MTVHAGTIKRGSAAHPVLQLLKDKTKARLFWLWMRAVIRGQFVGTGNPTDKCLGRRRVDLLMTVTAVALLIAVLIPTSVSSQQSRHEAELRSELGRIRSAVHAFYSDTGCYPNRLSDLTQSSIAYGLDPNGIERPIEPGTFYGPYLLRIPTDPVTQTRFFYQTTVGSVGVVSSSAAGIGSDGIAYSLY